MSHSQQIIIHEGRLLPGLIACFAFVLCGLALAVATDAALYAFSIAMALLGIWPAYRVVRPRWILQLEHGSVRFRNVPKRRTVEVKLTKGATVQCRHRAISGVGAEGGIGFWRELVIHSEGSETVLPLPFLEVSASSVCSLVKDMVTEKE
jgi:hypothetical protein